MTLSFRLACLAALTLPWSSCSLLTSSNLTTAVAASLAGTKQAQGAATVVFGMPQPFEIKMEVDAKKDGAISISVAIPTLSAPFTASGGFLFIRKSVDGLASFVDLRFTIGVFLNAEGVKHLASDEAAALAALGVGTAKAAKPKKKQTLSVQSDIHVTVGDMIVSG